MLNCVWLFVTPSTVACQASLCMGFPKQEYWSGLLFPTPGDLPNPGIEPTSLASPALVGRFFTTEPPKFALRFTKFPHIMGLKFCVNGTSRNWERTNWAYLICSCAHVIILLDFTHKTQVQRWNHDEFPDRDSRALNSTRAALIRAWGGVWRLTSRSGGQPCSKGLWGLTEVRPFMLVGILPSQSKVTSGTSHTNQI